MKGTTFKKKLLNYDLTISGAGLVGLSLAARLLKMPCFEGKKVLLLDKQDVFKFDN